MINVRIETKPSFKVVGRKIWISGQDNSLFSNFWHESHENGLISKLQSISRLSEQTVTKCGVFGVSRVENDPNNRAFYFYIAVESDVDDPLLDSFDISANKWAIFSNQSEDNTSPTDPLVEAEMYAFMEWLPNSKYIHALAPELEVYPEGNVEFWIPISEKLE